MYIPQRQTHTHTHTYTCFIVFAYAEFIYPVLLASLATLSFVKYSLIFPLSTYTQAHLYKYMYIYIYI